MQDRSEISLSPFTSCDGVGKICPCCKTNVIQHWEAGRTRKARYFNNGTINSEKLGHICAGCVLKSGIVFPFFLPKEFKDGALFTLSDAARDTIISYGGDALHPVLEKGAQYEIAAYHDNYIEGEDIEVFINRPELKNNQGLCVRASSLVLVKGELKKPLKYEGVNVVEKAVLPNKPSMVSLGQEPKTKLFISFITENKDCESDMNILEKWLKQILPAFSKEDPYLSQFNTRSVPIQMKNMVFRQITYDLYIEFDDVDDKNPFTGISSLALNSMVVGRPV